MDSSQHQETPRRPFRSTDRVALFLPCYIDQLYPAIGRAVMMIFDRLGIALEYPESQTCCGQPAFNSGYWADARPVVHHFAEVFEPYDWVVVPSGSCATMARVFFERVDSDPAITRVAERVYELASFLVDVLGVIDVGAEFPRRVTYHDSCHARRELGILDAPRKLLASVRGLEFVELPQGEECCGFGGLFSVKFSAISTSMGSDKLANVRASGAEVLVSGDASCLMHLAGIMGKDRDGRPIPTMHLAELLAARGPIAAPAL